MAEETLGLWGTRGPDEPARQLAAKLVERHGLTPPIDIEALLSECADISYEDWPFEGCDALVHDLNGRRPKVFVRQGLYFRRRRLTLAHEYGHIKMAWHLGGVGCKANASEIDIAATDVSEEAILDMSPALAGQERESTRFASYLLLPDSYVIPLIKTENMSELLAALNKAEVSSEAVLMRLRAMLQPGFCFTFTYGRDRRVYTSPGTELPPMPDGIDLDLMRSTSADSGMVTLSERKVSWFRLVEFGFFQPVVGNLSATAYLRSAIAASEPEPDKQRKLLESINGVVGGSLSKERAQSAQQAFSILRHKFDFRPDYGDVITHEDFDLYLRKKVQEWAQKRRLM